MAGELNTGISAFQGVLIGSALGIALLGGGGVCFQASMPKGYTPTAWKIKKFLDSVTLGVIGCIGGGIYGALWVKSPHLQITSLYGNIILYSIIGAAAYKTTNLITKPILHEESEKISLAVSLTSVSLAIYR